MRPKIRALVIRIRTMIRSSDYESKALTDNVQDIVYSKNGHDIVYSKL
jgi:hypothetical protein